MGLVGGQLIYQLMNLVPSDDPAAGLISGWLFPGA
jgi:hypothetical protein